ncbi:GNAT family N-acetyltransferase [Agromyces intestinalis]|uniref:GNAT family N-acetyltransferase n=1 Tax=Agromyces intestinalis TaxID=2592652 RepID=A0A5C1YB06_9MICO|nr:GNAT family N-acetyltransferase [Agromyces intestinalis]QEO13303.1 GNAT family N-acetyltransferase [Agromyces intestinalis]
MAAYTTRPATPDDGAFLADMVVEAANWNSGHRPRPAVLDDPVYRSYIAGWQRPGDAGVVAADDEDRPIGAAWYRLFQADRAAHGFVAIGVPELIIGVRAPWRAQGVGRSLMRELTEQARRAGFARMTLSVERGNFARSLYRSEGFVTVEARGGRETMVRRLR